jgi:hypothetical protein
MAGLQFENYFKIGYPTSITNRVKPFLAPLAAAIAIFTETVRWQSQ